MEGIFPRQIKRTDPLVEALDAVASAVWKAQQVEWMMDEIMHRLRLVGYLPSKYRIFMHVRWFFGFIPSTVVAL